MKMILCPQMNMLKGEIKLMKYTTILNLNYNKKYNSNNNHNHKNKNRVIYK